MFRSMILAAIVGSTVVLTGTNTAEAGRGFRVWASPRGIAVRPFAGPRWGAPRAYVGPRYNSGFYGPRTYYGPRYTSPRHITPNYGYYGRPYTYGGYGGYYY